MFTALRPRWNGCRFADDIFGFFSEKYCILIHMSLQYIPRDPIDIKPAWRWTGDKPLLEPLMALCGDTYIHHHYNDVIMSALASQITSLTITYSTVYSRRRSKKTSKLRATGLCAGNSPVTGEFPARMASNAENVSIWWRHHDCIYASFGLKTGRYLWVPVELRNYTELVNITIN